MEVTITIPDDFAARVQALGCSPQDYVKLLFSDAMRRAREREVKSRPEDTRKFLEQSAAEAKAKYIAEIAENEAEDARDEKRRQEFLENLARDTIAPPISTSDEEH